MDSKYVISTDTGEVISELHKGDRIVRTESINYLRKKVNSDFKNRSFVKIDYSEGAMLIKELSQQERSLLYILQFYVSYSSGLIQYHNGVEMGFKDMVEISGFSRGTTAKIVDSLIEKDILYKGKNSTKVQYFLNPWVAMKGIVVNPTLKDMFKNYKIRSKGNICWKDLVD